MDWYSIFCILFASPLLLAFTIGMIDSFKEDDIVSRLVSVYCVLVMILVMAN